ncbi:YIF1-domain-containing protein [Melanogaster broomeanus]|nr:YIF1-domain-containing protein [Melanogaster broomeanus]
MSNYYSRSPPPLQHPVPTHPAFIPEPPSTPGPPPADFAAWGMNDATAHFGMQLGQSAYWSLSDSLDSGGFIPLSLLKHHFNVSNSYVIKKLQLVIFPWRHRPWSRKIRRSETGQTEWQPPRDDINCPDLYIPLMALVTYILVAALQTGLQERFHPQILGSSASRALVVVLLDFFFVKGGCYLLNVPGSGQVIDLIAYGGYKFLRSLRSVVLPDLASTATPVTVSPAQRKRRITFLFLEAVVQVVYMGILVRV